MHLFGRCYLLNLNTTLFHKSRSDCLKKLYRTRVWARIWSLGHNLSPLAKIFGDIFILGGTEICTPFCWCRFLRFLTKIAEHRPLFITQPHVILWFFRFPSILIHFFLINTLLFSYVSFFSDLLWLWVKKLSNVRARFQCEMVTIAKHVRHAWLSMRHTCSVEWDWNFPGSVLACNFFTEINLFVCASFRVFFPKFLRGQIVPLAIFLRDNFNYSAGLAQPRSNHVEQIY